jgi:macrolide-specific efflux system membrane fusion protein
LAGVVVQVRRRRGEWVQPGETVVRVLRIDRLRAEGFVRASDIEGDMTNAPVTLRVSLAGQPQEFQGVVAFVAPEIDPVNGQVRVWAEFDNPDLLLRPGLKGSMSIARPATASAPAGDRPE